MRRQSPLAAMIVGVFSLAALAQVTHAQTPTGLDTSAIEQATGLKGRFIADENVFKDTKPRTDVKIQVDGWSMPPFMGLGLWAAFTPAPGGAMMMGDTVVFEDEVNPAMSAALEAGLDVTGLHNHFFFDEPKVYFMHIGGTGDARALAAGVKKVYDTISEIRAAHPTPGKVFGGEIAAPNSISAAPLKAALGARGQANEGMFKVVLGRTTAMHGVSVGKEMGINTWAAFAGSNEAAVVDGDFAMFENELQSAWSGAHQSGKATYPLALKNGLAPGSRMASSK